MQNNKLPLPIKITESAEKRILDLMQKEAGILKLSANGKGCAGFKWDLRRVSAQEPDDEMLEQNGAQVLIDGKSLFFLFGTVIDFEENLLGSKFVFKHENASHMCGCGESFAV